jgi:MoaA/NifB/PqqE/SkfB family radical SAM enzyme
VETDFYAPTKNTVCCRLDRSIPIKQVQNSIKNQQRSPACTACWQLEDQNLQSERQTHNKTMDFLLDLNLENIEKQSLERGFQPLQIKLATSNLCNGQCVTCGPELSSSWAALEGHSSQYRSMDFSFVDLTVDWSKIKSLSFVGGEPLLEKKNFSILEHLIELKNTNCFISIVTNGSIELTTAQFNILSQFPKLNICLSIDGIDKSFEYMRFPLKWNLFLTNLNAFKKLTSNISVSCMISNLNIYYYSDLIEFFKEYNINYLCKQIIEPTYFSPSNLPEEAKIIVRNKNKKYLDKVNAFLDIKNNSTWDHCVNEIYRQDKLKNISIHNFMPEVAKFIKI